MNRIKISVIMPALNEEMSLEQAVTNTLGAFNKYSIQGEIIIVNDGSTDRTGSAASELIKKYPGQLKLVTHDKPMGVGRSFFDGVNKAEGEGVVMIPGDNENDPCEILSYTKLLDNADLISPFVVNREIRPLFRNILSKMFTFIINISFGFCFNYTNGTVIYRRSIFQDLDCRSNGFFFQAEALVKASKKGYLVAEVPYFLSERKAGSSKAVSLSSLKRVLIEYVKLFFDIHMTRRYRLDSGKLASDSKRNRKVNP